MTNVTDNELPDTLTGGAGDYDMDQLLNQSVGDMTKNEPIPEGVYHCRVKAEVKRPKKDIKVNAKTQAVETAYPYVNWTYIVTGSSPEEFHGRHLFEIGTLKPGATFVNRQVLEALGFDEEVTLKDALQEIATTDYELLVAAVIEEEGKGADGKWYPRRNKVAKRLQLQA